MDRAVPAISQGEIVHDDETQTISDLRLEAGAYAVIQPIFRLDGRGGGSIS